MSQTNARPDPLAAYIATTGKSDAEIGRLIGASRWKISRARRGDTTLPLEDQIALEAFTGVSPARWTEFYAAKVKEGGSSQKKSPLTAEADA